MNDNIDYCHHDSKTLNTSYYQVLNGGRSSGKTFQTINMYQEKYVKLQSNWNSLKDFFEKGKKEPNYIKGDMFFNEFCEISLDKMNKLEGGDKE